MTKTVTACQVCLLQDQAVVLYRCVKRISFCRCGDRRVFVFAAVPFSSSCHKRSTVVGRQLVGQPCCAGWYLSHGCTCLHCPKSRSVLFACVFCTYLLLPSVLNLLHAFTLQFPPLMISRFLSLLQSKCCLQGIKNEFIVTPSAANNYATKANVGPADKPQCILNSAL